MESELRRCLKSNWGHDRFRPYQLEVIEASLAGRDTFVLMATGSGKSICYQLPAVTKHSGHTGPVTVVVSPLVSLMEDQVLSLSNNGISACMVGGASDMKTQDDAIAGRYPLVFITPEKVAVWGHGLRAMEGGPGLALFAVDESHCVAEWGHDFRKSYMELRSLRESFPKVPIMALTATATPRVQTEIMGGLGLRNPLVAKTSFNRWNLHYSIKVVNVQSRPGELSTLLRGLEGSAIIYVLTKKEAEQLTADVARIVGAKGARTYHGGMPHAERRAVHHGFIRDEIQVVVATVAFGMGIDKPDVRVVIHCGMPKTVEAYYQQTGRAGRDGLPAKCILLFSRADGVRQRSIMAMSTNGEAPSATTIERGNKLLAEMESFATGVGCRRRSLLRYFGEDMGDAKCDGCDSCDRATVAAAASSSGASKSNEDVELFTAPARLVLQAVQDSGGRYGFAVPISLLLGTTNAKNRVYNAKSKPSFGKGKERGKNEAFWKALFHQLVEREGFLESVSFSSDSGGRGGVTYRLTDDGRKFLRNDKVNLPLSFTPSDELAGEGQRLKTAASSPSTVPQSQAVRDGLSEEEQKVYALVQKLRSEIATRLGIPPYNVLGGQVVKELAKRRPIDLPTLATVDGMSEKKVSDYGADIIKVLVEACKELKLEGNMPPLVVQESAWLSTTRDKPVSSSQLRSLEEYNKKGSLTLEQVAAGMSRPISASSLASHLAACLEGGMPFAWDRRRLCIEQSLETKVMSILESFKREGNDPLTTSFRLKPVYEELPPDTDKSVYSTMRLILARMRFESKGGRLPRSSGPIVATPPSESVSGKKRALPTWGGGGGGGGGASGRTKKETPAWRATPSSTPPTAPSLFTPSYTPPPRSAGKDRAGVGAIAAAATAAVDARATRKPSEPWTSDSVLRVIKEAGSLGATLEAMIAANPGDDDGLQSLLGSLQEDFAIFTKPAEVIGGQPVFLAL